MLFFKEIAAKKIIFKHRITINERDKMLYIESPEKRTWKREEVHRNTIILNRLMNTNNINEIMKGYENY